MRQQLRNIKNEDVPKRPKTVEDIRQAFEDESVLKRYGYTLDNERRLYVETAVQIAHSFTIFASHAAIEFVKQKIPPGSRNFLLDGTFSIVPRSFYQLLSISVEYMNDVSIYIFSVTLK